MRQSSGRFTGAGGLQIYYRLWEPEVVRSNLVICHGALEHGERYEHVAAWFVEQGFAVWALDHRGHGRSEGFRMYVERFEDYLTDLGSFIALATAKHGKPVLLGHSMGGLISFRYGLAQPDSIAGLVLSSPWFEVKVEPTAIQKALLPLITRLAPRLPMPTTTPPEIITRNPAFHARDKADPLIALKVTPHWWVELNRAAAEACHTSMTMSPELPVLIMQAGEDHLVKAEATQGLFERLDHPRKAFRLYPKKYHEILNDPGHEEVLTEILTWLKAQGLAPA